jgi:hypothetical protein
VACVRTSDRELPVPDLEPSDPAAPARSAHDACLGGGGCGQDPSRPPA